MLGVFAFVYCVCEGLWLSAQSRKGVNLPLESMCKHDASLDYYLWKEVKECRSPQEHFQAAGGEWRVVVVTGKWRVVVTVVGVRSGSRIGIGVVGRWDSGGEW